MKHTPYGYDIIDGKAVVNEEKAANLRRICENYLSGMSFKESAADVGLMMNHGTVKQLLQNKRYPGDDYYPSILTKEMVRNIETERIRRAEKLGRIGRKKKQSQIPVIHTAFTISRILESYDDPIKQAEYVYSLIKNEDNKA